MKLKRCCRTCKHLCPQLIDNDMYDWDEKYIPCGEISNCGYDCSDAVDKSTDCEFYEAIGIKDIMEGL